MKCYNSLALDKAVVYVELETANGDLSLGVASLTMPKFLHAADNPPPRRCGR